MQVLGHFLRRLYTSCVWLAVSLVHMLFIQVPSLEQARVVAKRKSLWGRVKSGSQVVMLKETQRQLVGAIKERPWLAPATLMGTVALIFALAWVFATYGN